MCAITKLTFACGHSRRKLRKCQGAFTKKSVKTGLQIPQCKSKTFGPKVKMSQRCPYCQKAQIQRDFEKQMLEAKLLSMTAHDCKRRKGARFAARQAQDVLDILETMGPRSLPLSEKKTLNLSASNAQENGGNEKGEAEVCAMMPERAIELPRLQQGINSAQMDWRRCSPRLPSSLRNCVMAGDRDGISTLIDGSSRMTTAGRSGTHQERLDTADGRRRSTT